MSYRLAVVVVTILTLGFGATNAVGALVVRFDFEEGSGNTMTDSVSGLVGAISGATFVNDAKTGSGALSFDGDDFVTIAHDAVLTPASLSISLWVRIDPTQIGQSNLYGIFDKGHTATLNYALQGTTNANASLALVPNGPFIADQNALSLRDGEYHHLAFNQGPAGNQMFVDGVLLFDGPGAAPTYSGTPDLIFGAAFNLSRDFRGVMDDFRIYDAPLSQADVSALFQGIPEPASVVLGVIGGLGIFARRSRRRRMAA